MKEVCISSQIIYNQVIILSTELLILFVKMLKISNIKV